MRFVVVALEPYKNKYCLKLSCQDHREKCFCAFPSSVKIEKTGPPNQFFCNNASPLQVKNRKDGEGDSEPIRDGVMNGNAWLNHGEEIGMANDMTALAPNPTNEALSTDGKWTWTAFTQINNNDERGSAPKTDPGLKYENLAQTKNWTAVKFFNYCMQ